MIASNPWSKRANAAIESNAKSNQTTAWLSRSTVSPTPFSRIEAHYRIQRDFASRSSDRSSKASRPRSKSYSFLHRDHCRVPSWKSIRTSGATSCALRGMSTTLMFCFCSGVNRRRKFYSPAIEECLKQAAKMEKFRCSRLPIFSACFRE